MKKVAFITGASKGIGLEIARIHAAHGDDLILTARSLHDLQEIKTHFECEYPVKVTIIAKDLSMAGSAEEVFDEIKQQHIDVDYLVNNAGFGDYGYFADTNWDRYSAMINLNISSLTELCHLFISDWQGRKAGKILNVASTAAFQPGPKMAVYFATKAYVLSFSQAIGQEVKKDGITITAFCPGPTNTNFMDDSQMIVSRMVAGHKLPAPKEVARCAYKAMISGKSVAIHGTKNRIMANLNRFVPRSWATKITDKLL
ncbi:SDR family oxidoreductase [Proteiniphilum sp.]|uniref:SDR family NAD(P)-dependent oxidoreductase n=1 Tax=Proteiniphilum sp. TaxID=1926877 RepID=UPI0033231A0E